MFFLSFWTNKIKHLLPCKITLNSVQHFDSWIDESGNDDDDDIAQQIQDAEAKAPEDLTEEDKMALLGRPKNGDTVRAQLRIKESKEFKVSLRLRITSMYYQQQTYFYDYLCKKNYVLNIQIAFI